MTELYSVEQLWLETVCSKKREERVAGAATGGYSSHWKRIQKFYNGTSGFEGRFFYKMHQIVHDSNQTGIFKMVFCFRISTSCWSWRWLVSVSLSQGNKVNFCETTLLMLQSHTEQCLVTVEESSFGKNWRRNQFCEVFGSYSLYELLDCWEGNKKHYCKVVRF